MRNYTSVTPMWENICSKSTRFRLFKVILNLVVLMFTTININIFFSSGLVLAENLSSKSINIQAVVVPVRYILINSSGKITRIYSNTNQLIKPTVYLRSFKGPKEIFTNKINVQYTNILKNYKALNNTGLIYDINLSNKPISFNYSNEVIKRFSIISTINNRLSINHF